MGLEAARDAIHSMAIRGATRIAVAAADALAHHADQLPPEGWQMALREAAARLASARPTAVSLENGLAAILGPALRARDLPDAAKAARRAAHDWGRRLRDGGTIIAREGAAWLPEGARVLTHCNSASAMAVLVQGHRTGRVREVLATETRPWRQGLLTARALAADHVPCTLVVDSAAGHCLREGKVDAVVVGADTVCADGTLINKVGTAQVALAAHDAGIPVLCATSSCKFTHRGPAQIVIEERDPSEVVAGLDFPVGTRVFNPVFDRTKPAWVDRYVTEHGVAPPRQAVVDALKDIPAVRPW